MIFNLGGGTAAPQLTSIAVTVQPTTTTYEEGASFNKRGMEVTAYFDDGSSSVVTGYTCSPSTMTAGTKTVTISYTHEGITKTATIGVVTEKSLYTNGVKNVAFTDGKGGWNQGKISWDASAVTMRVPSSKEYGTNSVIAYTTDSLDVSNYNELHLEYINTESPNANNWGSTVMLVLSSSSAPTVDNATEVSDSIASQRLDIKGKTGLSGTLTLDLSTVDRTGRVVFGIGIIGISNGETYSTTTITRVYLT